MTVRAHLARYLVRGQHRAGRMSLEDRHAVELEVLRARVAARRRHPAGRRLVGATA